MEKPFTLSEGVDSWNTIIFLYNSALKEVRTKVEILNDEFQQLAPQSTTSSLSDISVYSSHGNFAGGYQFSAFPGIHDQLTMRRDSHCFCLIRFFGI